MYLGKKLFSQYVPSSHPGFEPLIAPKNFNRTEQEIDIYEKFNAIKQSDNTASFIYTCDDTKATATLTAVSGIKYLWGETRSGGVEYVSPSKVASGNVFTSGSTKRWVCGFDSTPTTYRNVNLGGGSEAVWLYISNPRYKRFDFYYNSTIKYVHCHTLSEWIYFRDYLFWGASNLEGELTIPANLQQIGNGVFKDMSSKITGHLHFPSTLTTVYDGYVNDSDDNGIEGITSDSPLIIAYDNVAYRRSNNLCPSYINANGYIGTLTLWEEATYVYHTFPNRYGDLTIPDSVVGLSGMNGAYANFKGILTLPNNSLECLNPYIFIGASPSRINLPIQNITPEQLSNFRDSLWNTMTCELHVPVGATGYPYSIGNLSAIIYDL